MVREVVSMSFLRRWMLLAATAFAVIAASACMNPRPHRVRVSGNNCASCHMNDYLDAGVARDAGMGDGGVSCTLSHTSPYWLPQKCELCHQNDDWCNVPIERIVTNHAPRFPLTDGHAVDTTPSGSPVVAANEPALMAQCMACHEAPAAAPDRPDWVNIPTDCASCHLETANRKFCATSPSNRGHAAYAEALPCGSCHLPDRWWPAVPGLHPANAGFSSRHADTSCQGCHNLELVALQQPSPRIQPECLPDGGVLPADPRYQFPASDCPPDDSCPECSCVQCHSEVRHAGDHTNNTEYDDCRSTIPRAGGQVLYTSPAERTSMCWTCHPNGFGD